MLSLRVGGPSLPSGTTTVAKIFIAYDTETVRAGLRELIVGSRDWELCGEAKVREAYELVLQTQPDVVLIETVELEKGRSLARLLREDLPKAQCLLFTLRDGAATVSR